MHGAPVFDVSLWRCHHWLFLGLDDSVNPWSPFKEGSRGTVEGSGRDLPDSRRLDVGLPTIRGQNPCGNYGEPTKCDQRAMNPCGKARPRTGGYVIYRPK